MHRFAVVVVVAAVLGLALYAAPALAGGDPAAGQARSLACQVCHVSANPAASTPHLVGQRASYLAAQLRAFKAGDRKDDLMSAIAGQLSDADIANLAAYWSAQPAGSDGTVPEAALAIRRSRMAFPRNFPAGFVVYSTESNAENKLVIKSYASTAAVAAARAGKPLLDGSAIVVVNYSVKLGANGQPVTEKDGSFVADKPVSYSAMESRAGWGNGVPDLLRNADWSYNVFGADKSPRAEFSQGSCLACHKPAAAKSYVFTLDKIKSAR